MMQSEGKSVPIKKIRQVCRCEKCGNEAELEFTCRLEPEETVPPDKLTTKPTSTSESGRRAAQARGTATCVHCGNEAEMWIDI